MVTDKIKTLLNFKNDFNLTNSTVQIQIIFMDKNNTKDNKKINYTSNYLNRTNNNSNRLQDLEIHKKIQIGNEGKISYKLAHPIKKSILIPMRFKEKSSNFFGFEHSYSDKFTSLSKNQLKIMKLEKEENKLHKKLDFTLFENINKSNPLLKKQGKYLFS